MASAGSQGSASVGSLEHIEDVGAGMVRSMRDLLSGTLGPEFRASDLVQRLKLDKSLASRVTRSLSSTTAFEALHETAAPRGLSRVIAACAGAGAESGLVSRAEVAVARFDGLLESMPDGRAGLATVLGARVGRAKETGDREARKSVFRGMVHLRGFRVDTVYACGLFMPSAERPGRVDFVRVSGRFGLRRLRDGFVAHVTSVPLSPAPLRLDGSEAAPPGDLILDAYSEPFGEGDLVDRAVGSTGRLYALADGVPAINHPIDIVTAVRYNATGRRYAGDGQRFEEWTTKIGGNAELAVFDVFVHRDVFRRSDPPAVTGVWGNLLPASRRELSPDEFRSRVDPLDQDMEALPGTVGLRGAYVREIPKMERILGSCFDELGVDADAFRHYRYRQDYPVGNTAFTFWFELDRDPDGG